LRVVAPWNGASTLKLMFPPPVGRGTKGAFRGKFSLPQKMIKAVAEADVFSLTPPRRTAFIEAKFCPAGRGRGGAERDAAVVSRVKLLFSKKNYP
jgi:hypothetical protein